MQPARAWHVGFTSADPLVWAPAGRATPADRGAGRNPAPLLQAARIKIPIPWSCDKY